ncbi:C40 family peptidase [Azomonas macrocytogenes]|uniref:Cell wall-associated NlpC family hydrolase n=1 Tax=Azomonas macrocytogenes TaxID=69962 RepID=A0A839TBK1_AZOMA|nr:C40 family peptidase [Azomonas macrocytogenes]MBB3104973.1 cell wall-associated NlpC family hydrolase [Azomonas macrocytogenes]
MPAQVRILFLLFAALLSLTACTNHTAPAKSAAIPKKSQVQAFPPMANEVLFRALGLVGTPYVWGGNTPESGFDCSGLIGYVYRDAAGIVLPRTTSEMIQVKATHIPRQSLLAGDLVFFATSGGRRVSHAGIYVGEERFVHAPSSGGTVRLDRLSDSYWQRSYLGARRILDKGRLTTQNY